MVHHCCRQAGPVWTASAWLARRILKEERNYTLQLVKKIAKSGCNVLLIQKSILRDATSDLSLHFLVRLAAWSCCCGLQSCSSYGHQCPTDVQAWVRPATRSTAHQCWDLLVAHNRPREAHLAGMPAICVHSQLCAPPIFVAEPGLYPAGSSPAATTLHMPVS